MIEMLMLFRVVGPTGREYWINASDVSAIADENPTYSKETTVFLRSGTVVHVAGVSATEIADALHLAVKAASEQLQTKLNDAVDQLVDAKSGKVFQ